MAVERISKRSQSRMDYIVPFSKNSVLLLLVCKPVHFMKQKKVRESQKHPFSMPTSVGGLFRKMLKLEIICFGHHSLAAANGAEKLLSLFQLDPGYILRKSISVYIKILKFWTNSTQKQQIYIYLTIYNNNLAVYIRYF
jgi:hypothetical protein